MKSTGVVRKVDGLGRLVFPIELRRTMGFEEGTAIEILVDKDTIVLRKYIAGCYFCGEENGTIEFGGVKVCKKCGEKMYKHLKGEK